MRNKKALYRLVGVFALAAFGLSHSPAQSLTSGALGIGELIVTSPANNDFVGTNTQISFRVRNANVQVTVKALIEQVGGTVTTTLTTQVTPDAEGNANGTLTWQPTEAFPQGHYHITVTATEPGNNYNTVEIDVTLDTIKPKFVSFAPLRNSFVKGNVTIRATIDEANIEEWRVTVDDQDLPNNTGSSNNLQVLWDTSGIEQDGEHTIKIFVKDKANNTRTQEIPVTLDRVAPIINVQFPASNQRVPRIGRLSVQFDIVDASDKSVDMMAIVADLRTTNNVFLRRVARERYISINDTTARWIGRVELRGLPGNIVNFRLVITATDRAGNQATPQIVPLRFN